MKNKITKNWFSYRFYTFLKFFWKKPIFKVFLADQIEIILNIISIIRNCVQQNWVCGNVYKQIESKFTKNGFCYRSNGILTNFWKKAIFTIFFDPLNWNKFEYSFHNPKLPATKLGMWECSQKRWEKIVKK